LQQLANKLANLSQEKKSATQQNEELREQLKALRQHHSEGFDERKKYMEGAVWMAKKLSNEIEKVCQSYEFLLLEYHQRVKQAGSSSQVEE